MADRSVGLVGREDGRSGARGVGRRDGAALAYDAFAPFYDLLTEHQDYDWWWSVLLDLCVAAGLTGRRVLDVACGTGRSLRPLVEQGWLAVGADASAGMLAEARRKLDSGVELVEQDMRALPRLGEFDLVSCLNDALNNVHDEQELTATFAGFRRNLAPRGVVVFDVNTIATFRSYAALVRPEADRVLIVEGDGEAGMRPGTLLSVDFAVLERGEAFWSCDRTTHVQRHHPDAEIRRALQAAGLELVLVRGQTGFEVGELDELRDEKAVYVARVAANDNGGDA